MGICCCFFKHFQIHKPLQTASQIRKRNPQLSKKIGFKKTCIVNKVYNIDKRNNKVLKKARQKNDSFMKKKTKTFLCFNVRHHIATPWQPPTKRLLQMHSQSRFVHKMHYNSGTPSANAFLRGTSLFTMLSFLKSFSLHL